MRESMSNIKKQQLEQIMNLWNPVNRKKQSEKMKQMWAKKKLNPVSKGLKQFDKDGRLIKMWNNIADASEFFTGKRNYGARISLVCKNKASTAFGFIWKLDSVC